MPEALVVGAGLAGASCAISLSRVGWRVTVLERRSRGSAAGGAGIILHPNALLALARLDLSAEVQSDGTTIRHLVLSNPRGGIRVDLGEVWEGSERETLGAARADLSRVLSRALDENGVRVEHGLEVESVRETSDAGRVTLIDGRTLEADLVVGCDGVRSKVRDALDAGFTPIPTGLWWSRWLAPEPVVPRDEWHAHTAGTTVSGAYGVGPRDTHVFLQLPLASAGDRDAALQTATRDSPVLARAIESGARLIHQGPGFTVQPHVWRGRFIALAGDASHAVAPTTSEGGGLALEDGVVLADALEAAKSVPEGLKAYEEQRAKRVAWVARMGALQVRNAQRDRGEERALDASVATRYLREMYRPLDGHEVGSVTS